MGLSLPTPVLELMEVVIIYLLVKLSLLVLLEALTV